MKSIRKVRTWDELPPVVFAGDSNEAFSTRILEDNYRKMKTMLEFVLNDDYNTNQIEKVLETIK